MNTCYYAKRKTFVLPMMNVCTIRMYCRECFAKNRSRIKKQNLWYLSWSCRINQLQWDETTKGRDRNSLAESVQDRLTVNRKMGGKKVNIGKTTLWVESSECIVKVKHLLWNWKASVGGASRFSTWQTGKTPFGASRQNILYRSMIWMVHLHRLRHSPPPETCL